MVYQARDNNSNALVYKKAQQITMHSQDFRQRTCNQRIGCLSGEWTLYTTIIRRGVYFKVRGEVQNLKRHKAPQRSTSIYLSIHLSIFLSISPSIHLSIHLSIHQSIYLSIQDGLNECMSCPHGCDECHGPDGTCVRCKKDWVKSISGKKIREGGGIGR